MGSCLSSDGQGTASSPNSGVAAGAGRKQRGGRRQGSRSSLDLKTDELLSQIPGRMFFNGASSFASLFTQQGKKGVNQDAMIVWENFGSRSNTVFCGVFDGHGPFGHVVARRVRDMLPLKLCAQWEVNVGFNDEKERDCNFTKITASENSATVSGDDEFKTQLDSDGKEEPPDPLSMMKESFLKAFKFMDKELRVHPGIDCFCSGTTAVTLVKQGRDLIIGNVGDSRAILATRDEDNILVAVQLTVDLKPDLPREAERIRRCRGRVFALRDEPEVSRVWLPNINSPGLAMARAFGDFCLKDFGLIAVPDISFRRLTDQDEFIVLATDGVWDVLSNEEVISVVAAAPSRSSSAKTLVEAAARAWRSKFATSKMDDCAAVCLFLDSVPGGDAVAVRSSWKDSPDGKDEGEDWSALEGVSRVNTLLTLPRILYGYR
ncbi:putative protein phosphatase 2C 33 [Wolffia australiana]